MTSILRNKNSSEVIKEWDDIATLREYQISSGLDHSAIEILAPAILQEISMNSDLIDIGCGTGWLTSRAGLLSRTAIGIDPSQKSIKIAIEKYGSTSIVFSNLNIEDFSVSRARFDTAISNMVASSVFDLDGFIGASRKVLKLNGVLIMTIPHPCFWSKYWGYIDDHKFFYTDTCTIEGKFKIQNNLTNHMTTHFHHSLERYFNTISSQGFVIESLKELQGKGFHLPRFLLIKARAI